LGTEGYKSAFEAVKMSYLEAKKSFWLWKELYLKVTYY